MRKLLDRLLKRGSGSEPPAKPSATAHEIALQHARKELSRVKQPPGRTGKMAEPSALDAGLVRGDKTARRRNEHKHKKQGRKTTEDVPYGLEPEQPSRRKKESRRTGELGVNGPTSRRSKRRKLESFI